MGKLNLSFVIFKGTLKLCVQVADTDIRHRETVKGLINPNLSSWDKKKQCFCEATETAIRNNTVLSQTMSMYQTLLEHREFANGKELFTYAKVAQNVKAEANITPTFGGFLEELIKEMRGEQKKKLPSANYQVYINLQYKLKKEAKVINMPIDKINDLVFENFGEWISDNYKNTVYVPTMKRFHSAHEKARKKYHVGKKLEFEFLKYAPRVKQKDIRALSTNEYKKFTALDLTLLGSKGRGDIIAQRELYRDYCIFLYEMKMRPVDVLNLRLSDIKDRNIHYYPNKLKNNRKQKEVIVPISPKAKELIKKYKGKSSQGYIFPFAMNEYIWNLENAESYKKWYNRKRATLEQINCFLHGVEKVMKIDSITIYIFRHTAITHEVKANKPIAQIAKEAGTSIQMIDEHYYNHLIA